MGYIHVYTGNGKGKTTAAVGAAVRMAGAGGKVLFFQFLKNNRSSERRILETIPNITVWNGLCTVKFTNEMTSAERAEAAGFNRQILAEVKEAADKFDLIVLDEICTAAAKGLAEEEAILSIFGHVRGDMILTGRYASKRLTDSADYVTEMKKCAHPYDKGVAARRGIEY